MDGLAESAGRRSRRSTCVAAERGPSSARRCSRVYCRSRALPRRSGTASAPTYTRGSLRYQSDCSERIDCGQVAWQIRADVDADAIADQLIVMASCAALIGRPLSAEHVEEMVAGLLRGHSRCGLSHRPGRASRQSASSLRCSPLLRFYFVSALPGPSLARRSGAALKALPLAVERVLDVCSSACALEPAARCCIRFSSAIGNSSCAILCQPRFPRAR